MGQITNSPLIEAIFELRWGEYSPGQYRYSQEETEFLPGILSRTLSDINFKHTDNVNHAGADMYPMMVRHRFREEADKWPCFQYGLGIFTVNEIGNASVESNVKDQYDWDTFKPIIVSGVKSLNSSLKSGLSSLSNPVLILKFRDGFKLNGDSIEEFVKKRIVAEIKLDSAFTGIDTMVNDVKSIDLNFSYETLKPKGSVTISVTSGIIKDEEGIIIDTIVASEFKDEYSLTVKEIEEWCEEAHDIQRHSFKTLIAPGS